MFGSRPFRLNFYHYADFHDLISRNMEERTRTLRVPAKEDEEPFPPQGHAGFRCGQRIHAAQEERGSFEVDIQSLCPACREQAGDIRSLHKSVLHDDSADTLREWFDADVMAAGDGWDSGGRGGEEDQLFMKHFVVPYVLYEGRWREIGKLGQVHCRPWDAGEWLREYVFQIRGQLRHFAPEVLRNEPPPAVPGGH